MSDKISKRECRSENWFPGMAPTNPQGTERNIVGLAKKIRAQTRDGQLMIDFALKVLLGQRVDELGSVATLSQRIEIMKWLQEVGYGKPAQSIELHATIDSHGPDLSLLSREELQQMDRLLTEATLRISGAIDVEGEEK